MGRGYDENVAWADDAVLDFGFEAGGLCEHVPVHLVGALDGGALVLEDAHEVVELLRTFLLHVLRVLLPNEPQQVLNLGVTLLSRRVKLGLEDGLPITKTRAVGDADDDLLKGVPFIVRVDHPRHRSGRPLDFRKA